MHVDHLAVGSIPEEEEESVLDAGVAAQQDDFRKAAREDKGHELSLRGQGNDQTERATALSEDLSRLMDERDALLRTGMYTKEDEVIQEIGRCVERLLVVKSPPHEGWLAGTSDKSRRSWKISDGRTS